MVKISDLRMREVINILDGKKLGNITDIELDLDVGRVVAIILPGRIRGFSFFSKREELVVPWHKIVRIGRDVILVEVPVVSEIEQYRGSYRDDDNF
ncbi:MAG: YlmC/YmxH family sporulation protein [Syntrophomonadaceae bacterium]|jgi:YlmC/YmxH family sporulation protein